MAEPIWTPPQQRVENSNLFSYMQRLAVALGRDFKSYDELYQWSIEHPAVFWESIWQDAKVLHSRPYDEVQSGDNMLGTKWFLGAQLNFAENVLRHRDDRPAIVGLSEFESPRIFTYIDLHAQVARAAAGLKALGVTTGDRVAAFIPNIPEAIIAMLATTSLGAIWSSCSPDFGIQGVFDRFGQIEPKVLIAADGYHYNGKAHSSLDALQQIVARLPSLERVVIFPRLAKFDPDAVPKSMAWPDLLGNDATSIEFAQLPFDHPVYIMYSSGTTGVPKCMVHGAGGTLLQHYKELRLHTDLRRHDVITYYTTCGWMMWNWLVSSLQIGATVLVYDGSPAHPDLGVLWKAIEDHGITVFGTSPKYLSVCQKGEIVPRRQFDLSSLRTILSTGAPLTEGNFEWVYKNVKKDVQLASISGGTDIISCFMLGCPLLPVYKGEIQCRGLGMKVEAYNHEGQPVIDEVGELVCSTPFPSMPVYFWNDPDGSKYRRAYFEDFEGVWRHGDYVRITPRGGLIVHGRSDATLNPGGVRIGTAEIYTPVEALEEVVDSIVVGQQWQGDVRIILFVVLAEGLTLDDALQDRIKQTIRGAQTPRHVPARIIQVQDIPRTINAKKVEVAVRRVIHGQDVPNKDALANPEALDQFADLPELKEA